jgi:hypothetical protein
MLICLLIAVVLNILYMYAMSYYTEICCMIAIFVYDLILVAGMAFGAYLLVTKSWLKIVGLLLIVFCAILAMLFNILLACFWSNIKIAIAVLDATADFLVATKRLILVSFGFAILGFIVQAILFVGVAQIKSMGTVKAKNCSSLQQDLRIDNEH